MKKPEEIKKVTLKCPWCGAEMRFDADSIHVWFKCDNCLAASPKAYRIWDTGLKTAENWAVNESIALDRIQQLEAQVPRWIPVEERPPEVGVDVSIIIEYGGYQYKRVGWMRKSGEWFQAGLGVVEGKVSHWAYLPEAPKEDAE